NSATCAPVIFGCAGKTLTADERALFAASRPLGFILFKRNLDNPAQVAALVADLRDAAGRADAPVLILSLTSDILDKGQIYDAASNILVQTLS
ncbi:hypothetical protein ACE4Z5_25210, partial [Salmonella enterica]